MANPNERSDGQPLRVIQRGHTRVIGTPARPKMPSGTVSQKAAASTPSRVIGTPGAAAAAAAGRSFDNGQSRATQGRSVDSEPMPERPGSRLSQPAPRTQTEERRPLERIATLEEGKDELVSRVAFLEEERDQLVGRVEAAELRVDAVRQFTETLKAADLLHRLATLENFANNLIPKTLSADAEKPAAEPKADELP